MNRSILITVTCEKNPSEEMPSLPDLRASIQSSGEREGMSAELPVSDTLHSTSRYLPGMDKPPVHPVIHPRLPGDSSHTSPSLIPRHRPLSLTRKLPKEFGFFPSKPKTFAGKTSTTQLFPPTSSSTVMASENPETGALPPMTKLLPQRPMAPPASFPAHGPTPLRKSQEDACVGVFPDSPATRGAVAPWRRTSSSSSTRVTSLKRRVSRVFKEMLGDMVEGWTGAIVDSVREEVGDMVTEATLRKVAYEFLQGMRKEFNLTSHQIWADGLLDRL